METNATSRPSANYHVAGAGREVFTRFQIRDQIRDGAISPETELAPEGSDEFRSAASFPELSRYFALSTTTSAATGVVGITPSRPAAAHARPDLGFGLALKYPLTGHAWILIVAAAFLQVVPFGPLLAGIATSLYTLSIIRKSSEAQTSAPAFADMGAPAELLTRVLKMIVVTLVSAWPIFVAIPLVVILRTPLVIVAAAVVMVLYYPAAVASLAKWDSIRIALTPSQIFRFIGILGADYFMSLMFYFVLLAVAGGAAFALGAAMPRMLAVAGVVTTALVTWASFAFFHLVGVGMARHADELQ